MRILVRILLLAIGLIAALALLPLIFNKRPAVDRQLCSVLEAGNTNELRKYLTSGGDVNRVIQYMPFGKISAPLISVAIRHGQLATIDLLLKNGANPNQADSAGYTPVMWTIGKSGGDRGARVQMLKLLLKSGADPNLKASSTYGWTPLIEAAELGQAEMVSTLLSFGAQVNATNNAGQIALQYTDEVEIAQLLIGAGADTTNRMGGETPTESAIRRGKFGVLAVLTNTPVKAK
jgi:ankyrin repeat protein